MQVRLRVPCEFQCLRVRVQVRVRVELACAFVCLRSSLNPSESDIISFPFPVRHRDHGPH
jgi:hypothetical protein